MTLFTAGLFTQTLFKSTRAVNSLVGASLSSQNYRDRSQRLTHEELAILRDLANECDETQSQRKQIYNDFLRIGMNRENILRYFERSFININQLNDTSYITLIKIMAQTKEQMGMHMPAIKEFYHSGFIPMFGMSVSNFEIIQSAMSQIKADDSYRPYESSYLKDVPPGQVFVAPSSNPFDDMFECSDLTIKDPLYDILSIHTYSKVDGLVNRALMPVFIQLTVQSFLLQHIRAIQPNYLKLSYSSQSPDTLIQAFDKARAIAFDPSYDLAAKDTAFRKVIHLTEEKARPLDRADALLLWLQASHLTPSHSKVIQKEGDMIRFGSHAIANIKTMGLAQFCQFNGILAQQRAIKYGALIGTYDVSSKFCHDYEQRLQESPEARARIQEIDLFNDVLSSYQQAVAERLPSRVNLSP